MTAMQVMGRVLLMTFLGTVFGAGLGFVIGTVSPGFVNGLLGGSSASWPASQTGIGLGIANGAGMGFVTGIVAVVVEAFGKKREK